MFLYTDNFALAKKWVDEHKVEVMDSIQSDTNYLL